MYQRRNFLKTAATGIALTAVSGKIAGSGYSTLFHKEKLKQFGLQLYTLRDVMPADPKGILKQVAAMGYKQIESYPHDTLGMYWGMKNTEFKKYVNGLGMQLISSHSKIEKDFEIQAAGAGEIGMKYLISGSLENENKMDSDAYKKAAELFNKKGEICKKNGLRFAFHNHDQAFMQRKEGMIPEEILLKGTDPALVDFEMDIYWVVTGGQDPVTWLRKYPNRFTLCHIKDRKKMALASEREVSVNVGEGSIDFQKILNIAKKNGMQYYIVEQEKYDGTTPLAAAKADADFLKKLRI